MEDIQLARYDRVFDGYARGDEYLTRSSFTRHIKTLAEIRGESPDAPALAAFGEQLGNTWSQLAAISGTDDDGRVSRDDFRAASLQVTAGMRQAADEGLPWPFEEWVTTLYEVIDADGDGHITKEEYTDWLSALGLAEDTDIDRAFGGFDTNSDGNLSRAEFSACYHQFWSDFDPDSPGHRWIGP